MANDGMLSNILKNLSIAGTGLGTGLAGAIPAATSLMATGGKWLSGALNPEDTEVRSALDFLKNVAEKATPEALQGYAEQASGGYLKPTTPIQRGVSEISADIGSMVGLGSPVSGALKLATLGNTAKQAAKYYGASDETANTAKLVGMMTSPLFKFNNIKSLYSQLYKDAESALQKPQTKGILQSKSIRDAASDVFEQTLKGTAKSTAKTATRGMVKGALRGIVKGALKKLNAPFISVSEVWEMNKDINNELAKMGKYTDQKAFLLKPFREAINSKLKLYGERNKDFGYAFKNAQTLFGIEKGLSILDKVINKTIGLKDTGLAEYFRKSLAWGIGGLKGLFAKKILDSMSRRGEAFVRSPAYRKASIQLAKATARNSVPMVANSLRKLANIHDEFESGLTNAQGTKFKFINEIPALKNKQRSTNFKSVTPEELQKRMQG